MIEEEDKIDRKRERSVVSFFFFSWPLCCCGLWLKALNPAGVALFFLVKKW